MTYIVLGRALNSTNSTPHVKAVFGRKKVVKIGPINGGFSEI